MVEEARLESVYTPKGYPGFESPSFRRIARITKRTSKVNLEVLFLFMAICNKGVEEVFEKKLSLRRNLESDIYIITMKRLFLLFILSGILAYLPVQRMVAQEASEVLPVEETEHVLEKEGESKDGIHKVLKVKFIEGSAFFMSWIAIAFVIGLAFCIERIIYLSLSEINTKKFVASVESELEKGDVEAAKERARNTRGPVASIYYQGLMRIDQGVDVVEKSMVAYGGVQSGYLEKGCSWISLFIAIAPSLGFLGTVIGMVQAFDKIQQLGDISATAVAGGMKVALITTIFGLIVALILQVFYNYILSKIEALTNDMEDASVSLLDMVIKYELRHGRQGHE